MSQRTAIEFVCFRNMNDFPHADPAISMTQAKSLAFVAYPSKDKGVAEIVANAVHRANALDFPVRYEPWIFNDVPGVALASPILSRIEESAFVVADITTLNLNVVFEIGYAIGCQRRVFLIRNSNEVGDKELAKEAGIFDTLGYFEYAGVDILKDRLTSHIESSALPFNQMLDHKAPIYIVEPLTRSAPTIMLTSRVKKAGYRYRSFNPAEDVRLSATDAIRQVASSSGVVMLLQEESNAGATEHNIRALFVAGLPLNIRAARAGDDCMYVINRAFWPALGVRPSSDMKY